MIPNVQWRPPFLYSLTRVIGNQRWRSEACDTKHINQHEHRTNANDERVSEKQAPSRRRRRRKGAAGNEPRRESIVQCTETEDDRQDVEIAIVARQQDIELQHDLDKAHLDGHR